MTDALESPPAALAKPSNPTSVSPLAILIWLLVQLAAMALIIARVRIWIGGGNDAHALGVMIVIQIALASVLMPSITQNLRTLIIAALATTPFLQIAGLIAAASGKQVAFACGASALWLISLYCARRIARSNVMRATIHALAMCVSIGGVVMLYLREEFFRRESLIDAAWFGPIAAAVTLVRDESSNDSIRAAWIALVSLTFFPAMMLAANRIFSVARRARD